MEQESPVYKFGFALVFVYIVNCTVGSGFLLLPYVYQKGGLVLSMIIQIYQSTVMLLVGMQLYATLARADSISRLKDQGIEVEAMSPWRALSSEDAYVPITGLDNSQIPPPKIKDRRIDLNEMIKLTLGRNAQIFFSAMLIIAHFPSLASYVMIFATSFTANVPLTGATWNVYEEDWQAIYSIYAIIFMGIVTVLTMVGYGHMRHIQTIFCVLRLAIFVILCGSCLALLATESTIDSDDSNKVENVKLADYRYIGLVVSVIQSAAIFQFSLPEIAHQTGKRSKNLTSGLVAGVVVCGIFYLLMGIIVSLAVEEIEEMATIEWQDYTGGTSQDDRQWWAYMISMIVVLFPALDVVSIFPLVAIMIANNGLSAIFGYVQEDLSKWYIYGSRIAVIVPPFLFGLFFVDIAAMFSFAGLLDMIVITMMIPVASFVSKRMISRASPYDWKINNAYIELAICLIAGVLVIITALFWILYPYKNY